MNHEGHEGARRSFKKANSKLRIKSTLSSELETLIQKVIGLAMEVHTVIGPGYVEIIYERAMCFELDKASISYLRQIEILVPYKRYDDSWDRSWIS